MLTATLQEAKATLNKLVEAAEKGEQVVLMRGAQIVATILPLTAADVEISGRLTDAQAEHFWNEVSSTENKTYSTPQVALKALKKSKGN